jgi:hypothetical protein
MHHIGFLQPESVSEPMDLQSVYMVMSYCDYIGVVLGEPMTSESEERTFLQLVVA